MTSLYLPPGFPCAVDLRLDGNEGAVPPQQLLDDIDVDRCLRSYPRDEPLRARLAARFGTSIDRVAVTAGADDALDRIVRCFARREGNVVLPEPTFVMLRRNAELARTTIRSVPWPRGAFPIDAVCDAIDDASDLVFVVSPNNPTGAVATAKDLDRLVAAARGATIVVDLAYADFADEDLTTMALDQPQCLVVRTFSKAWGLAGCRVGYVFGSADKIAELRAIAPPFAVSSLSLEIAMRRLDQEEDVVQAVARARAYRERLTNLLRTAGLDCHDSQANFVLVETARAAFLRAALAGLGIAVRAFNDHEATSLRYALRITCPGNEADMQRLERALEAILRPEILVVDDESLLMDDLPLRSVVSPGLAHVDLASSGARRAWLLTKSCDSIASARSAGFVAIGIAADSEARTALHASGAGVVLDCKDRLREVLP